MASRQAALVHVGPPQTVVPTRAIEPGRRARPIAVAPVPAAALQSRARVVLYYGADGDGAPLWEEAVWVSESLSEALADHHEMTGRLRRHADDGSLEVKLNDAGVRYAHATAEATVAELVAAGDEDRACWEAALAPWTDVDAEDPGMCALFYLQLTRFQGDGGYAVGVSCSLLLSDPPSLVRFLLSWARTHAKMKVAHNNGLVTNPLVQYASYFQHPDAMARPVKSIRLDASAAADETSTVLFRARATSSTAGAPGHRALASACVDQARERLGVGSKGPPPQFSVVAGDGRGGMGVGTCTADGETRPGGDGGQYELEVTHQWHHLGLEDLMIRDSKPVYVSCSKVTGGDVEVPLWS